MKITLITVGKIKEKYLEQAIAEYAKRLGRYCKLEIIQVTDEKTPDGASASAEEQIKEKEGQRILAHIKEGMYVIADFRGAGKKNRFPGNWRSQPHGFCNRRLSGTVRLCIETGRLSAEFFQNDVSAPVDAGDFAGTDLPQLPDYFRCAIP